MRILIVDDDESLAETIREKLSKDYITDIVFSGRDAIDFAEMSSYDVIVLDSLLPDINGIEVLKTLRLRKILSPIIFLTGQASCIDKVKALNCGADDYLTKPFDFPELEARLRALLRRNSLSLKTNTLKIADLSVDIAKKTVIRGNKKIFLRRKEFELLEYLIHNKGKVLNRDMILNHVWDNPGEVTTNIVDVNIKYLRDRIDKPFEKKLIKTVYNFGYKIEA